MLNWFFPFFIAALLCTSNAAYAERPMTVDDASTLEKGGAKIEFGWSGDKNTKGTDGLAGLAPIENLEIEVGLGRTRDRTSSPSKTIYGRGLALKWVPLQSALGLSLGLKYELSRDRAEVITRTRTHTLIGLLSWSSLNESIVHVNIGREAAYEDDTKKRVTIWGIGLDCPVTDTVQGTAEIYGVQRSGPNRAVGLRYEIMEGLKLSGAIGHGNKLTFGNVDIAWEF